jgi:hypothetical protein
MKPFGQAINKLRALPSKKRVVISKVRRKKPFTIIMPQRTAEPTNVLTSLHGLTPSAVVGTWPIREDERGTYIAPIIPTRRLVSYEKGFVGSEIRLYFDLTKLEPDPQKNEGTSFLRSGLQMKDAISVDVDLSS